MKVALRWTRNIALVLLALLVLATIIVSRLWQDRPAVADFGWPTATPVRDTNAAVTVTWLGISTLLFQILIDGTFTRLRVTDIAPLQTISSDVAAINHALSKYRIDRLAAIVPAHSHFDHAMDIGYIANRTSAVILGSQSTMGKCASSATSRSRFWHPATRRSAQMAKPGFREVSIRHCDNLRMYRHGGKA